MSSEALESVKPPLGVRHALMVYACPTSLFRRVEDTGAYGWALVVLLGLIVLTGYAEVQTGLIDRTVDLNTEQQLAQLEATQLSLVDRVELREQMDSVRKSGEFTKLISRLGVIVLQPVYMLASFLFIASVLYAMVALTGRKPEYHTLMSIVVYAGFIELVSFVLSLWMKLHYRTIEVNTSLSPLAADEGAVRAILGAVDPFRIWFWILVAIGLTVTRQLSRRMAIASVCVMGLVAFGVRVAMAMAASAGS